MHSVGPRTRGVAAVAAGGVVGAEIRYLLGVAFPADPGGWPWTTFWINITGCLLIGVLYTVLAGADRPNPLLRPLLGVGVLGGYTTFSTWSVETVQLAEHGRYGLALGYALASPVVATAACAVAVVLTRRIGRARWTR
ncbi:protein CrcB [Pseudonocardia autotrophica]|uniref:Fluoride-specific ion channel FluC n=2 Tax=Pseudonocardia TaxID=1847 RepID=A0A1Y2MTI6_PSEAH|nr:putative fluoride ion transporter CrcB [Pseudonocardia autotrophica]TDN75518.1 protein CrcB [Pseudonocardia autotrophica]BBF99487.1 putative fluoride ion transporter CrcB 1 [Pseudonocardia autotrophica]GEC28488.1 putative fluoride ion transporter CrcB 1 [Pseudonocardia saturnea]